MNLKANAGQTKIGNLRRPFLTAAVVRLLALGFFGVAVIPLFLCTPPPLCDYPNHLARMHILTSIGNSAALEKYYVVHWQLIPNLAMDIVVPLIASLLPLETAMLVFTLLSLSLICAGTFAIHRVLFKTISASPIAVFLLLYNRQFLLGFLNYLFGLGVAFLTLAAWIKMRNRSLVARTFVFACLFAVVFICHLAAFGVLAVLICGFELQSAWKTPRMRMRTLLSAFLVLAGSTLVLFLLTPIGQLRNRIELSTPRAKVAGLVDVFNNYNLRLDIGTFVLVSGTFLAGYATRRAEFKRDMILPISALILLYLGLPLKMFDSDTDRRLTIAIAVLIVGSTEWRFRNPLVLRGAIIAVTTLFLVRMAVIAENWKAADRRYASELAVIDQIPYGAKLTFAVGELGVPWLNNPPLRHFPSMAVVRRDALVPSLFVEHQPVSLKLVPDDVPRRSPQNNYTVRNDLHQWVSTSNPYIHVGLRDYDYLLIVNKRYFPFQPPSELTPIYDNGWTTLYRIQNHD